MHKEYFQQLLELLKIELEEDRKIYHTLLQNTTPQQRIFKGFCWEPLRITDMGFGLGDYPFIVVERTKHKETTHQFSGGKPVAVYLSDGQKEYESVNGTIHYVHGDTMKIVLNCNDHPEWLRTSRIGVNMLFDEKSYQEMQNTLEELQNTKDERIKYYVSLITGKSIQHINTSPSFYTSDLLNQSQIDAVNAIARNNDICVIHGPPGTGKTTTLVKAIQQVVKQESQVLVCAPSNAAADLLTERLATEGVDVLRIGNLSRIDEHILQHTIDARLTESSDYKRVKDMRKQAAEYKRMALKFKRNFGKSERDQRNALLKEARFLNDTANDQEDYAIEKMVQYAQVITCTLVGANHQYIKNLRFKTVFIDEAAQALEPSTWIPIIKAEKVVLAGDPFQLPPTVKSAEAKKAGLETTLIEKCLPHLDQIHLLNVQYRMHKDIMQFSNDYFYAGQLKAHSTVENHTINLPEPLNQPVEFIDTAGCSYDEILHNESRSYYNPGEFELILKHLASLHPGESSTIFNPEIGVIAPYKEQLRYMQENIAEELYTQYDLSVNTIDSFQGQERDIIYITMVRSNANSEIGFLKDYRRMNVAMTRARKKLVIIGDSATLSADPFYDKFINYCMAKNYYKTAWEYLV